MQRILSNCHVLSLLIVGLAGVVSNAEERVPMTNERMGQLLTKEFGENLVQGREGAWRIEIKEDNAKDNIKEEKDAKAEEPEDKESDDDADGEEPQAEGPEDEGPEDEGPDGEGELELGEIELLPAILVVLTDANADRMRLMMPICECDFEKARDLRLALIALHANYDRALDARYALKDGILWSAFIHPLESLTAGDLKNGITQVRELRKNTGTSFSSTQLQFGPPAQPQQEPEVETASL